MKTFTLVICVIALTLISCGDRDNDEPKSKPGFEQTIHH